MLSKNSKLAERSAVNRDRNGKEDGSPLELQFDARGAMRAKETGKRKNALGGPRKSLIRLDSDKENPSFSFDWLWPASAGFCSIWPN
jgi:hypothetical protein